MRSIRLVVVIVLTCAACSRSNGPVEIPASDLPFSVARTQAPSRSPVAERTHRLYFVRDGKLHEVNRKLEASGDPAAVLRALLEGPDAEEAARGITTEIPGAVRLLGVVVARGAANVDLSGEFQQPASPEEITIRVAEVVWTLTSIKGVRSVSFSIDGETMAVTTHDGTAVERRVTRSDYTKLAPPS